MHLPVIESRFTDRQARNLVKIPHTLLLVLLLLLLLLLLWALLLLSLYVNKYPLNYYHPLSLRHSNLADSRNSTGLTDQALLIRSSAKNFLNIWHVLSITVFALEYIENRGGIYR